ncbi:hypothetical protein CRE_22364 [Caenorhabditis remanei]|uniref:NHR domain-containing protein n=1 Tax=Caenorhabditis remanei TaxID=31234 RepID=E3MEB9_CAERE|nr:hypothetical protein CRE_22364 [Caenorhabditis remanei]
MTSVQVDAQTPVSVPTAQIENSSNEQNQNPNKESDSSEPYPLLSMSQKRRKMDKMTPLRLHAVCGDNVLLNRTCVTACRDESNNKSAFVFTERAIKNNEKVWIRIMEVVPPADGSLTVGVTTFDPATLRLSKIPEDLTKLVMKPGYWNFKLDAANKLNNKSILAFWIDESDQVWCDNIDISKPQMCFQMDRKSEDVYMFFDMGETTRLIRVLGVSKVRINPADGKTVRRSSSANDLATRNRIETVETKKFIRPSTFRKTEAKSSVETPNVMTTPLSLGNKTVPQVTDPKSMTVLTSTTKLAVIKTVGSWNHGCNGMSRRIRKYYQRAEDRGTLDKFYSVLLEKSSNGSSQASTVVKSESANSFSQNLTMNQVTSTSGTSIVSFFSSFLSKKSCFAFQTTTTSRQGPPSKQTIVHGCIAMPRRIRKYHKRIGVRGTLDKFYSAVLEKIATESSSASTEAKNQMAEPHSEVSHITKGAPAVEHTVLQNLTAKQVEETLNVSFAKLLSDKRRFIFQTTMIIQENARVVRNPAHGCIRLPRRMRKYLKRTDIRGNLDKFYSTMLEETEPNAQI